MDARLLVTSRGADGQVRAAAVWWDGHSRQAAYLWPDERLQPVYQMQARLSLALNPAEQEFIRLEFDRLMEEIDRSETPHRRRSWIGERLNTLGDHRPGVGLVHGQVPLRTTRSGSFATARLRPRVVRLWGDTPEHAGLPDLVWVKVGGDKLELAREVFAVKPFYIAQYPVTYTQ